ncbi:MAG: hypothetical protein WBE38_17875 [Terracidiphilus sp.]
MAYKVVFAGAQAHEQTPQIAVYSLDTLGRVTGKIAVSTDGELDINRAKSAVIALGPDVEQSADLNPQGLVTLRLADQLATWEKTGEILIPSQWWRGWLGFTTCVSGNAYRCFPLLELASLRANALGRQPIIFPERCEPLCNAIVEVWEYITCCWPFVIVDVPKVIGNLSAFLTAQPIMFPVPPQPDPGPLDASLVSRVDTAFGAGNLANTFVPSTTLAVHLETLRSLSAQDAVTYFEAHPILWPYWCTGSSAELGETVLNPDGSFSYCYRYFPFFRPNCRTSYFYKVKQLVNGAWTYVYDGAAAHQYFSADEVANLYTLTGQTCFQPPALGNDYIALQAIGSTNTYDLNSNWNGATGTGIDLTQTGDTSMATLIQDAGLVVGSGAPWATTLALLLNYDPALQSASPSPYYYRLTAVQADATGNPMAGATPITLMTPISWAYFDTSTNPVTIASQSLGPVSPATVNGNVGLFQIPYFGGSNPAWLGNQFHQYLDTTTLPNVIAGGPGIGNGQYLLILEVFDSSGNRLVPEIATPTATDTKAPFNYIRLLDSTTTANVPFNSLTHVVWVDNRPVVGAIDYFMTSSGVQVCQFYKEKADTPFYVGFQAYHAVMCDASPSPVPANSFMSSFDLTWQEGLAGTSGTLASGDDTNWGIGCVVGVANAISTATPPVATPPFNVPAVTFGEMLGTDPVTHKALTTCSFALTLGVYPKHTNGSGTIWGYESIKTAALALSD